MPPRLDASPCSCDPIEASLAVQALRTAEFYLLLTLHCILTVRFGCSGSWRRYRGVESFQLTRPLMKTECNSKCLQKKAIKGQSGAHFKESPTGFDGRGPFAMTSFDNAVRCPVSVSAPDTPASMDSRLLSLFYCTFDNVHGPKIVYQEPDGFLPDEAYKQIASYGILPESLCNKLITISAGEYKIMSYALGFGDLKYERAKLHCNFSMVFPKDANTAPYEPVLCKLSSIMDTLERESGFLADKANDRMKDILAMVYRGLTQDGECKIDIDKCNSICLRLMPRFAPAGEVKAHAVPVVTYDLQSLPRSGWDLTLQRVLSFVDGVRHVKGISEDADMDLSLVEEALRHLMYYRCITMVDIFQFSNIYVATSKIAELASNRQMQLDCVDYISCKPREPSAHEPSGATPNNAADADDNAQIAARKKPKSVSFHRIFQLYCDLTRAMTVKEMCLRAKPFQRNNIDPRRFAVFGVMNGFLRRVHLYPIVKAGLRERASDAHLPTGSFGADEFEDATFVRLMDGDHNTDEIAVECGMSWPEIKARLRTTVDEVKK